MAEYRIDFTIYRGEDEEIGFGSSATWGDLDACTYAITSAVSHGQWETEGEMPDPDTVLAELSGEAGRGC